MGHGDGHPQLPEEHEHAGDLVLDTTSPEQLGDLLVEHVQDHLQARDQHHAGEQLKLGHL